MPTKSIYKNKEGKNYPRLLLIDGSFVPFILKCNRYSKKNVNANCGITLYVSICCGQKKKSGNNSGGATPLHDW